AHFAETIRSIKNRNSGTRVEVLIPDFQGSEPALKKVVEAMPDVINHNLETLPRLYCDVRPQAGYARSLQLFERVSKMDQGIPAKSGIMLGLGERQEEVLRVFKDLIDAGCQILTIGQYLSPSSRHHQVVRYIPPDEFSRWEEMAYKSGFKAVASGPFVRSSFHAGEIFLQANLK
ncbi:MAG: lipoyl synthase, partial [Deltaproteobacteria bacterium]|nr:lipoyl synthase [Deltaproteobacteria bacterium]